MQAQILAPAAVLVLWSLLVLIWVAATRFSGMSKAGIDIRTAAPGGRGADLEAVLDPRTNWKSHNYTHLMEQPTVFYAIALTLALMDMGGGINLYLAWGYVGLRIIHSIVQATINIVQIRFTIFALATLCLLGLTVHAGARILHDCLGWGLFVH